MRLDARIPAQVVALGQEPPPSGDVVLLRVGGDLMDAPAGDQSGDRSAEGWAAVRCLPDTAIDGHGLTCACCAGRSRLAEALGLLFAQRARAELPWFDRLVLAAAPDHLHDVVIILRDDALVSGRFRHVVEK